MLWIANLSLVKRYPHYFKTAYRFVVSYLTWRTHFLKKAHDLNTTDVIVLCGAYGLIMILQQYWNLLVSQLDFTVFSVSDNRPRRTSVIRTKKAFQLKTNPWFFHLKVEWLLILPERYPLKFGCLWMCFLKFLLMRFLQPTGYITSFAS